MDQIDSWCVVDGAGSGGGVKRTNGDNHVTDSAKAEAVFKKRAEEEQRFRDAEADRLNRMRSQMAQQKAARLARDAEKA
jgi:hypothetical protein